MGVQVVHHQNDFLSFREVNINQVTHTISKVDHGASICHFDMSPTLQRSKKDKKLSTTIRKGHHVASDNNLTLNSGCRE